jgi:hypothetical protein
MALFNNPWTQLNQMPSALSGLSRGIESGMGLARQAQEMALRKAEVERANKLDPLKTELAQLQLESAKFGLGQKKSEAERVAQAREDQANLDDAFMAGMPEEDYLRMSAEIAQQLPQFIEQKKAREAQQATLERQLANEKFDRDMKRAEFARKSEKDRQDILQKQLDRELKLQMPNIEFGIEQQKLFSQLPDKLSKRIKPGKSITANSVKNVVESTTLNAPFIKAITEINSMIDGVGGQFKKLSPKQRAKIESKMVQLQMIYKGEEFAGLGVLAGVDYDLIKKVTGDPTAIFNFNTNARLKELEKTVIDSYNTKLDMNNFTPMGKDEIIGLVPNLETIDFTQQNFNTPQNQNIFNQAPGGQ